ncbi:hypothetical protein B0H11DRAFT_2246352 [Mycena galericulata]|nr:hypothetical protein B0H11DRAFT_2246352 [Mycena galericulata]
MAPPPGQSIIPSHLDRPPSWPTSLPSLRSLLDYLAECEPIALYRAEFGRDFLNPREPYARYDPTAFRTNPEDEDDEVPFIGMLFGRVAEAPLYHHAHSTFVVDAGPPEATEAHAVFAGQMSTLEAPVAQGYDLDWENNAKIVVSHWNNTDRLTQLRRPCITVHLAHVLGAHCTQYAPRLSDLGDEGLETTTPSWASDYTFGVGDWILATVTLHRRVSYCDDERDYEILARHLRVLPGNVFDIRHEAPNAPQTIVAPEISPPTPETRGGLRSQTRKREHSILSDKEEELQVGTPSKRTRRKVDASTPVPSVPEPESPPKCRRQTARISTGGRPAKSQLSTAPTKTRRNS